MYTYTYVIEARATNIVCYLSCLFSLASYLPRTQSKPRDSTSVRLYKRSPREKMLGVDAYVDCFSQRAKCKYLPKENAKLPRFEGNRMSGAWP